MNPDTRSHVHALVDQLPPPQLAAVASLLQSMLDPVAKRLATAQIDDEPYSEEDRQAVAEADEWLMRNKHIPLQEVLGEFGLTMTDWEAMARKPHDKTKPGRSEE